MPTALTAPGVYIEEIPGGNRPISPAATSTTAFVGRAPRGPLFGPVSCSGFGEYERRFGGLSRTSELGHAVAQFFTAGGGTAVICRIDDGGTAASVTLPAASGETATVLQAVDPGRWGTRLRATVRLGGPPGSATAVPDQDGFHLVLEEIDPADGTVVAREEHPRVSADPAAARHVDGVLAHGSRLARVRTPSPARPAAAEQAPFVDGSDGAGVTEEGYERAIAALEGAEPVNLLCLPPPDRRTPPPEGAWTAAHAWARRHRAVLLVDPPADWGDAQSALDGTSGIDGLRGPDTAFYYPRIVAPDPLQEGRLRPFAPCGAVAGVLARTDATRGVWKAPAGTEAALRGAGGLETEVTDADTGRLTARGVNTLRVLPGAGPVVWGARTGHGADAMASEWKYLPVRRLALHIEASVAASTRWAVFEGNGEGLWSQLRLSIGAFMNDLWRRGAFVGATAREAYLVRCDADTTTAADVETGRVNVVIGFAPSRPAEFVVLRFQQIVGQDAA